MGIEGTREHPFTPESEQAPCLDRIHLHHHSWARSTACKPCPPPDVTGSLLLLLLPLLPCEVRLSWRDRGVASLNRRSPPARGHEVGAEFAGRSLHAELKRHLRPRRPQKANPFIACRILLPHTGHGDGWPRRRPGRRASETGRRAHCMSKPPPTSVPGHGARPTEDDGRSAHDVSKRGPLCL